MKSGTPALTTVVFKAPTGAPIDPPVVKLHYGTPGSESTLTFETGTTIQRTGVGAYQARIILKSTVPESQTVEWVGSGFETTETGGQITQTATVTVEPPRL